ncbi:NAD(P)H-hydrate dehydratase [Lysobacter sp. GCM10012299]|uniref:NAD(P)H-hydrate dehydratase n=1 Tax=Lysobacter sp. GCM10012299 TaxID=3317333 RepID=UPI00361DC661
MSDRPTCPLPDVDDSHGKESRGSVLVVGGSAEIPGAVLLAGTAALRAGAGKLQLASVRSVAPLLAVAMPEARVFPLPEAAEGEIAELSPALMQAAAEADAIIIGPGCEPTTQWWSDVRLLVGAANGVVVMDAGALGAIKDDHQATGRCILTPHAGEMAAITGLSLQQVQHDPLTIATQYSRDTGCIVVLKGATTHVVGPDGSSWQHAGGSIALGTSGSGDVLAGLIGGLAARGASPVTAAQWGVYLHGMAGSRFEQQVGEVGLLARELPAMIPPLLRELAGNRGSHEP